MDADDSPRSFGPFCRKVSELWENDGFSHWFYFGRSRLLLVYWVVVVFF